jgi:hypothetical protein
MSARIAAFIRQNVTGLIAIFIALGGTAYANNEWTGANIVDGSLTTSDYKNNDIRSVDVLNGSLKAPDLVADAIPSDDECGSFFFCFSSSKIADRAVGASEISPGAVGTSEAAPNSLTGFDVANNSLKGADVDESTLGPFGLPGPVSLTFADNNTGQICNGYCTEGSLKFIPPGTYLIMGKIQATQEDLSADSTLVDCEMVAGSDPATHDVDFAGYGDLNGDFLGATLPMQVVHTFDTTDNASIQCRDYDDGSSFGSDLKITAIKLGAVNGTATR